MRIIVPIKQVPETKSVKMDEATGTVIREGVASIVNPLDLYAIEAAIRLRTEHSGEVVAISMGPPKAITALKEAIAMGVDSAVLLSDSTFAGSDTWATSYILAKAIDRIGQFDMIICGERATDGDTGQVGPGIAAFLDLPVVSYVSRIGQIAEGKCTLDRLVEEGYEVLSAELPLVLTVVKEVSQPRLPTLRGKLRAKQLDIPIWTKDDLDADTSCIGLKGSPTRVVKISKPKVTRTCEKVTANDDDSIASAVSGLADFLNSRGVA